MNRKIVTVLVIAMLMIAAVPVISAAPVSAAEKAVVGLSLPTLEDPFYVGINNGAETAAEELGMQLIVESADQDAEIELANVEAMLDEDIAVLLISPVDTEASAAAIAKANAAEVPVVLVGMHVQASMVDAELAVTIAVNEAQGGALAASTLCTAIEGEGTVLTVNSDAENATFQQRIEGFNAYMAESCADADVIAFDAAGMDRDAFLDAFAEVLDEEDLTGVVSIDEALALPAVEASIIARKGGITFVGFDASDDALAALNQGRLQGIVLPVGWWMGETALAASDLLISGETVNSEVMINQGLLDIETVVRGPGGGGNNNDPRSGNIQGGGGDLQGGGGDLQGGGGDLQGGGGDLQGGGGDLQGGGGDLQGGGGDLQGGGGDLQGGGGDLQGENEQ